MSVWLIVAIPAAFVASIVVGYLISIVGHESTERPGYLDLATPAGRDALRKGN